MDDLTGYERDRDRLRERLKEVSRVIRETTDPQERLRQMERRRILRGMYQDACDNIERLRPSGEKRRGQQRQTVSADITFDFFERTKTVWADLEGCTWSQLGKLAESGSANQASRLLLALRGAASALTERQRESVMAYYREGLTTEEIARRQGVNRATVSRSIRRGLKRMERHILASLYADSCLTEEGFDFFRFASGTEILTERQRELLYLLLTEGVTLSYIARWLAVNKSSVSRGSQRIEANLSAVAPGLAARPSARRVHRQEWREKTERELAVALELSPATYYRIICRGEQVGGLPRLDYEILRLRGLPAGEAGRLLGLSPATVRKYWRRYGDLSVDALEPPEPYPVQGADRGVADLRRLLRDAAGTIGDQVDAATYRRMMELSHAGP